MPSIIDIRTNMFAGGVLYGHFMFIYRFSSESLNLPWLVARLLLAPLLCAIGVGVASVSTRLGSDFLFCLIFIDVIAFYWGMPNSCL